MWSSLCWYYFSLGLSFLLYHLQVIVNICLPMVSPSSSFFWSSPLCWAYSRVYLPVPLRVCLWSPSSSFFAGLFLTNNPSLTYKSSPSVSSRSFKSLPLVIYWSSGLSDLSRVQTKRLNSWKTTPGQVRIAPQLIWAIVMGELSNPL